MGKKTQTTLDHRAEANSWDLPGLSSTGKKLDARLHNKRTRNWRCIIHQQQAPMSISCYMHFPISPNSSVLDGTR